MNEAPVKTKLTIPKSVKIAIGAALIATIVIGIYPEPFIDAALNAAHDLSGLLPLGR
jgi:NADH:ubiquinone oxidoreductase subunit 2 (subunit N)